MDATDDVVEDNKTLTVEEETDTQELLSSFEWGVSDAQNFIQRPEDELNALEAVSLSSLVI